MRAVAEPAYVTVVGYGRKLFITIKPGANVIKLFTVVIYECF
jgi:hypothetical protein